MEDRVPISMGQTLPNPAREGQVLFAPSHAKIAKVAKSCTKENNRFELWSPALLGDLGVLCVMNEPSHAKSAKVAKDCSKEDKKLWTLVPAGSSWRSWRALRDARRVSRQERKGRKGGSEGRTGSDYPLLVLAFLASFA
jgi:hypothetical protein